MRPWSFVALLGLATMILECDRNQVARPTSGAVPVRTKRLTAQRVVEYDDYLASMTSRRSVTIYPQVSGYVRSIAVKPGQSVNEGMLLVDIDPGQQEANLRSLTATLSTRKANLRYAIQNDKSSRGLLNAGLLSELDYEQRHAQRAAAEAEVRAAEAQVQAQQQLLKFYRVTAPTAGIVGDVPVKVGDYVTPQSLLTSVDEDIRLEVYVYIPVDKTQDLRPESTIAVIDHKGRTLCEEKPTFVSPRVDIATQSVLLKTVCPNSGELRTSQVLTGRVIWSRHEGLVVPTQAISRLSGQTFVFFPESGPKGVVARQVQVTLGPIQGNDYVVRSGLSPGMEVVVSNVQKIREALPIKVEPSPEPSPGSGSAVPRGGGPPP